MTEEQRAEIRRHIKGSMDVVPAPRARANTNITPTNEVKTTKDKKDKK